MEEKKGIKISLFSVILMLIILVLIIGIIYMFLLNKQRIGNVDTAISSKNNSSQAMSETDTLVNQLNNQLSEKNKTIEQLEKEIANLKKTNSDQTPDVSDFELVYNALVAIVKNNESNCKKRVVNEIAIFNDDIQNSKQIPEKFKNNNIIYRTL